MVHIYCLTQLRSTDIILFSCWCVVIKAFALIASVGSYIYKCYLFKPTHEKVKENERNVTRKAFGRQNVEFIVQ